MPSLLCVATSLHAYLAVKISPPTPTHTNCSTTTNRTHRHNRFRPRYPQAVYDIILSHLSADQRELAVDVATGSGQAAVQLAQHFKQVKTTTTNNSQPTHNFCTSTPRHALCAFLHPQVLATDGNEQQLRHATPAPNNVTYQHGDAHSIPLQDGSVDLVTAASALHWFDLPRFFRSAICHTLMLPWRFDQLERRGRAGRATVVQTCAAGAFGARLVASVRRRV